MRQKPRMAQMRNEAPRPERRQNEKSTTEMPQENDTQKERVSKQKDADERHRHAGKVSDNAPFSREIPSKRKLKRETTLTNKTGRENNGPETEKGKRR